MPQTEDGRRTTDKIPILSALLTESSRAKNDNLYAKNLGKYCRHVCPELFVTVFVRPFREKGVWIFMSIYCCVKNGKKLENYKKIENLYIIFGDTFSGSGLTFWWLHSLGSFLEENFLLKLPPTLRWKRKLKKFVGCKFLKGEENHNHMVCESLL